MQLNTIIKEKYNPKRLMNITEYIYISRNNLTKEEYKKIIEESKIDITGGWISFQKKQLILKSGKILYKHILKYEVIAD